MCSPQMCSAPGNARNRANSPPRPSSFIALMSANAGATAFPPHTCRAGASKAADSCRCARRCSGRTQTLFASPWKWYSPTLRPYPWVRPNSNHPAAR